MTIIINDFSWAYIYLHWVLTYNLTKANLEILTRHKELTKIKRIKNIFNTIWMLTITLWLPDIFLENYNKHSWMLAFS